MHSTKPQILNQGIGIVDVIFFSPHLDDAVLSCGNRILQEISRGKRVAVITFFTKGDDSIITPDSQAFLKNSDTLSASSLFIKRQREDSRALTVLNVPYYRHIGHTDALFRVSQRRIKVPTYPSFASIFSGQVSTRDHALIRDIRRELLEIQRHHSGPHTNIYAPLAVGNHVDHVIIHETVSSVFTKSIRFWEDVPYRTLPEHLFYRLATIPPITRLASSDSIDTTAEKRRAVSAYKSQIPGLIRNGLSDIDYLHEVYYAR